MVHLSGLTRLADEGHLHALPFVDQVVMGTAKCQQNAIYKVTS